MTNAAGEEPVPRNLLQQLLAFHQIQPEIPEVYK